MATVAARAPAQQAVLWALVVGLILGVGAMHHLAAHHGAGAPVVQEHHAPAATSPGAHDAEPAEAGSATGPAGPIGAGIQTVTSSGHPTVHHDSIGFLAPAAPNLGSADLGADELSPFHLLHLCMAVLGGLLLFTLAAAALRDGLRVRLTPATSAPRWARPPRPRPPQPVPIRLAQLQILRL